MKPIDIDIHSIAVQDFTNYKLVDIREREEYAIMPAFTSNVHYVPFSEFPDNINYFNKNESYLIFCAKGGRSHYMAEVLAEQGVLALSVNNGIDSVNAYLKELG